MIKHSLETTDIFRGAFYLCKGGDLSEIRFRKNGRQIASFMFTGSDLTRHDKDYRNGHALVNPLQFRESLNHLSVTKIKQPFFPVHSSTYIHQERTYCS